MLVSEGFMRIAVLMVLVSGLLYGQNPIAVEPDKKPCGCSPNPALLYRPVVHAMWEHDEGEHAYASADGFIRIAVRPALDPEFFVDVRLKRHAPPTIVAYSLPEGARTVNSLLEKALKENPCADAAALAAALPIEKRTLIASKKMENLIQEFFTLRLAPRRIPDLIQLDTTQYEVEFVGYDTVVFSSDDYAAPMVKWAQSVVSLVNATSSR
jgi:hypothetical protein